MLTKQRRNLIFIEAAIITLIIYIFAIISNGYLDQQRIDELDLKIAQSSIDYYNIEVSTKFFTNFNKTNCLDIKSFILTNFKDLKEVGTDLSNYGQLFLSSNENISKLKQREYFLNELTLYNKVHEYNQMCQNDTLIPILYFFNSLSVELDKQSLILEQFNLNHQNETIIFSFDINYENEPLLNEIKTKYDVTSSPFIIIGNKTTKDLQNNNLVVDLNTITIEYKKLKGEIK